MAAPIVIPARTNPLNDAIQYAGNSIKQAIGLMQATKQLQVMEDANRVDAGKKLIDSAFKLYEDAGGGLTGWAAAKDVMIPAFKALGMDDQNLGDLATSLSTQPANYNDIRIQALNDFTKGRAGSYVDQPAGAFAAYTQPKAGAAGTTTPAPQATPTTQEATPSVTAPGTQTKTVDVPNVIANPNYGTEAIASLLDQALGDYRLGIGKTQSSSEVNTLKTKILETYGNQLQALQKDGKITEAQSLDAHKQIEAGTLGGQWSTPGFGTVAPWRKNGQLAPAPSPSIVTTETIKKDFKITGPLPSEIDTIDKKEKWVQDQTAAYQDMGAPRDTASMLAGAAVMLAPTVTPGKRPTPAASTSTTAGTKVETTPAPTVAAPVAGRPMTPQFPTNPPPGFAAVKPFVAGPETSDKVAYNGFKSIYEWWAKTVAGVEFKGSDVHISQGLSDYLHQLPTLSDRVTPEMGQNLIAAMGGPEKFIASLNPEATNAEANLLSAQTQSKQEARLGEKFFTWTLAQGDGTPIPGFESIQGKQLNQGQLESALQMLNGMITMQASSGTDVQFKTLYDLFTAQSKVVADTEAALQKQALADDPSGTKGVFNKLRNSYYAVKGSAYQIAYDGMNSFLENYGGWTKGGSKLLDVIEARGGPGILGRVWNFGSSALVGPKIGQEATTPEMIPPGGNGGATTGQAAPVDTSKAGSYADTFTSQHQ